jgi:hypothetical protein
MATSYTFKPIISDSIVFHIDSGNSKSYSGTGSTLSSISSAVQRTCTMVNGPIYGSYNGGSILFDGVNDYLNFSSDFLLNDYISKTFNIWFRSNSANNGTFIGDMGAAANRGWLVSIVNDGRFRFGGSNNLTDANLSYVTSTASGPTWSIGQWTNMCVTYNPTSTTASIYKDGVKLNTDIRYIISGLDGPVYASYSNSSISTQIGAYANGAVAPFNGEINLITIYNRELTQSEIIQNYNALKNRFI